MVGSRSPFASGAIECVERRHMRFFVSLALGALVVACSLAPQVARAANDFSDDTCPNATAPGRHLNDLTATPSAMSDDLMATAQALVRAYRECVSSVDQNQYNNRNAAPNGGAVNDSIDVDRLYARVALARSLRRVAMFDGERGDVSGARASDASAHDALEQVAQIGGSLAPGGGHGARHLVDEARDLEERIDEETRALGSPAPHPSPS